MPSVRDEDEFLYPACGWCVQSSAVARPEQKAAKADMQGSGHSGEWTQTSNSNLWCDVMRRWGNKQGEG